MDVAARGRTLVAMRLHHFAAALALLAVGSCLPTEVCGCPPAVIPAVVYGVVTADGAPVDGATVTVEHRYGGCESFGDAYSWVSRAGGTYRVLLHLHTPPRESDCFLLGVDPPPRLDLEPPPAERIDLTGLDLHYDRLRDSLRVDVELGAREPE